MKNIYHKIIISPLYFMVACLVLLTGHFKAFVTVTIIIIIHELGHISAALYYHWNINSITILPFAGLIKFDECIDHSLKEELVICLLGPLFQIVCWGLLYKLNISNFNVYNEFLLFLNLLPIYPLDGAKILNVLENKFLPFITSYQLTNIISVLAVILLSYYGYCSNRYFLLILGAFLIYKTYQSIRMTKIVFYKLILEKVKSYKKLRPNIITDSDMNRIKIDRNNYFLVNDQLVPESVFIKSKIKYLNYI